MSSLFSLFLLFLARFPLLYEKTHIPTLSLQHALGDLLETHARLTGTNTYYSLHPYEKSAKHKCASFIKLLNNSHTVTHSKKGWNLFNAMI